MDRNSGMAKPNTTGTESHRTCSIEIIICVTLQLSLHLYHAFVDLQPCTTLYQQVVFVHLQIRDTLLDSPVRARFCMAHGRRHCLYEQSEKKGTV